MRPVAQSDGHDLSGPFDKAVPGVAAVGQDIVVAAESAVREPVLPPVLPDVFDPCPAGHVYLPEVWFCSGERGGNGMRVTFSGIVSAPDVCHPA